MSSLRQRIELLEADLKAVPPRISVYHDLPFAILRYEPTEEWELRRETRLLATRLEAFGKEVHSIPMSALLWLAIEETEGLRSRSGAGTGKGLSRRARASHHVPVRPRLATAGRPGGGAARTIRSGQEHCVPDEGRGHGARALPYVEAARSAAGEDPSHNHPVLSWFYRRHDRTAIHGPQGSGSVRQLSRQDLRLRVRS